MILVEGLDNTGKTTLVQRIAQDFPRLQRRASIGNDHPPAETIEAMAWAELEMANAQVVSDRSRIISEYVYNPILRNRPVSFDIEKWFTMLKYLCIGDPQLVICCWRSFDSIAESINDREQLDGVAKNLLAIHEAYEKVMNFVDFALGVSGTGQVIWYNFTFESDYERVHRAVTEYLEATDQLREERKW